MRDTLQLYSTNSSGSPGPAPLLPGRHLRLDPQPGSDAPIPPPSLWARDALAFLPDPDQASILDCPAPRVLLCCTRQWGKSTVTAIRALHHAWFHPGSLIVCIAPVARQAGLFLQKVRHFLRARLGVAPRRDPRSGPGASPSLLLPNGSALLGLPATEATTRGLSAVDFLILDEAARIPDAAYHAVRPFLATTSGRLWLLSTPNGQAGFFYDEWHDPADPQSGWTRLSVPAIACPRISPDHLQRERRSLGEHVFAQEYLCRFLASRYQLVPRGLIQSAITAAEQPLDVADLFPGE